MGGGIPLLGKLLSRFNAGLSANSEHQLEAKRVFRQAPDQLIDLTNQLIQAANQQLVQSAVFHRPQGVLLLFDNLDRYPSQAIEDLLTRGATLMRHLACHAIYTIPVELRSKAGNVYSDEYDTPVILPMSALRVRDTPWAPTVQESEFVPEAVACFFALLEKRLNVSKLFEQTDDARLLVRFSGGCVRDLMKLVNASRQKSGGKVSAGTPNYICESLR